jgi:hypothetical protein
MFSPIKVRINSGAGLFEKASELIEGKEISVKGGAFEAVVPAADLRVFSL